MCESNKNSNLFRSVYMYFTQLSSFITVVVSNCLQSLAAKCNIGDNCYKIKWKLILSVGKSHTNMILAGEKLMYLPGLILEWIFLSSPKFYEILWSFYFRFHFHIPSFDTPISFHRNLKEKISPPSEYPNKRGTWNADLIEIKYIFLSVQFLVFGFSQ